jgi:hypothetical protein
MDTQENVTVAETISESSTVLFELSDVQRQAINALSVGKPYDAESIAIASFKARLKADFKRASEGAQKEIESEYDTAMRRGAKWTLPKDQHMAKYMDEFRSILNRL